ncbi:MAG: hydroxyacid dehydrogenase [Anaerolineae bacterium]|nr:hydroxyacid dehydrogenase [Anaerolineae bacterium]
MGRPLVAISQRMHEAAMARLCEEAEVRVASGWDEDSLIAALAEAEGFIMLGLGQVTRRVITAAPKLRIIARHGAGTDNIDLEAARERGVVVTNTPDATTNSVAEHTLALLLAVARRIALADRGLRAGTWETRDRCLGIDLANQTLGVVGFGRIGRRVASICHLGLGMSVVYYDPQPPPGGQQPWARPLPLDDLLAASDAVTLHVPLSPATRHLIGRRELALLKPTAILVNASRGPVLDEAALIDALREGRLAGAGLDVFEREPIQGVHPLCQFENVVLTPHIASATEGTIRRMAIEAVEEVLAVLAGKAPRYRVA